jgi:hypothetical protein
VPPNETIQNGLVVTSAILKGSQNPMGIPILTPHWQKKSFDSEGVGFLFTSATFIPATDNGNKHFQQISVIGLMNLPAQTELACSVLAQTINPANVNNSILFKF